MLKVAEVPSTIEVHRAIWSFMESNKMKNLKERDIIEGVLRTCATNKEIVRQNINKMIDKGILEFSLSGSGLSYIKIPELVYGSQPIPCSNQYVATY